MEIIDVPTDFYSRLPDDIVLEILSKLIDLKILCFCKLVSKRFNRIANNVDTVAFSYRKPSSKKSLILKPFKFLCNFMGQYDDIIDPFKNKSFRSAYTFMCNSFSNTLRDLHIQLPVCIKGADNKRNLFKWKVKFIKNKVDSFVFLSPNSIYDNNGILLCKARGERDDVRLAQYCYYDMLLMFWVLLNCCVDFPLLEKVCVMHYDKKGTVSVGSEELDELRKRPYYPDEYVLDPISCPPRVSYCYVPLLKLPGSGYVMKEVTLFLMTTMVDDEDDVVIDRSINYNDKNDDDFEDKVEGAYSEAMMQIFKKYKELLQRVDL